MKEKIYIATPSASVRIAEFRARYREGKKGFDVFSSSLVAYTMSALNDFSLF